MGAFIISLKTVLPLFLVILTGIIFSQTKSASETWVDILNKYALNIGLPALVIVSLIQLKPEAQSYSLLILINSVYFVLCMLLAFPIARILKLPTQTRNSLFLILSYGNVAYLGIPVLINTYGETIFPAATIIVAIYVFWLFTLGIILIESNGEEQFDGKKIIFNLFRNPLLIAVFIGLFILIFKIQLPVVAEKTILLFSNSVTAVVLFSLGIFLGLHKKGKPTDWVKALSYSLIITLILPFIFYQIIKITPLDPFQIKATILDSSMPLGLTAYALSAKYKLETALVARIVVLSTMISVVTIPLWIVWLG